MALLASAPSGRFTRGVAVTSSGRVPDLVDRFIYEPAQRVALAAASQARRLQSGSLRAYIAWLGAMVVVCLALLRAGWLS